MSNHTENTNTCRQCGQDIAIVGLDSSQCPNCNWIEQPNQTATDLAQFTRRKVDSRQQKGTQLDLFGGRQ